MHATATPEVAVRTGSTAATSPVRQSAAATANAVLLVDSYPGDVVLTHYALSRCGFAGHTWVARDGAEALDVLDAAVSARQRPSLVMMGVRLPKVDAPDVLLSMSRNAGTRDIPVVVLVDSVDDCVRLQKAGVRPAAFVVRPVDLDRYVDAVRGLCDEGLLAC